MLFGNLSCLPWIRQISLIHVTACLNNLVICLLVWGLQDPKVTWKRVPQTANTHPSAGDDLHLADSKHLGFGIQNSSFPEGVHRLMGETTTEPVTVQCDKHWITVGPGFCGNLLGSFLEEATPE